MLWSARLVLTICMRFFFCEQCLQWLWCLSVLCEVAIACDLATVDCIMTAEMIHTWAILLESAAEHRDQTQCPGEELSLPYFSLLNS